MDLLNAGKKNRWIAEDRPGDCGVDGAPPAPGFGLRDGLVVPPSRRPVGGGHWSSPKGEPAWPRQSVDASDEVLRVAEGPAIDVIVAAGMLAPRSGPGRRSPRAGPCWSPGNSRCRLDSALPLPRGRRPADSVRSSEVTPPFPCFGAGWLGRRRPDARRGMRNSWGPGRSWPTRSRNGPPSKADHQPGDPAPRTVFLWPGSHTRPSRWTSEGGSSAAAPRCRGN